MYPHLSGTQGCLSPAEVVTGESGDHYMGELEDTLLVSLHDALGVIDDGPPYSDTNFMTSTGLANLAQLTEETTHSQHQLARRRSVVATTTLLATA